MSGELVITDTAGAERIRVGEIIEGSPVSFGGKGIPKGPGPIPISKNEYDYWGIRIRNPNGMNVVEIGGAREGVLKPIGDLPPPSIAAIGGGGASGELLLRDEDQHEVVQLSATGTIKVGAKGHPARLVLNDENGQATVDLPGGKAHPGRLTLHDQSGKANVDLSGADAHAVFGGATPGRITAAGADGQPVAELIASHNLATVVAGQVGRHGCLSLYDGQPDQKETVWIDALGGFAGGAMSLRTVAGVERILVSAALGAIVMSDTSGQKTVTIDGQRGDIVLENADCAEEFDIVGDDVEPGTVMVIEEEAKLRASTEPYDKRVAGIISGAAGCNPGMILGRKPKPGRRLALALIGKAWCNVDATEAPVEVGDLLTTSGRAGHAMKATDSARAFGAVLGKALAPLPAGTGLIPVLVGLQ